MLVHTKSNDGLYSKEKLPKYRIECVCVCVCICVCVCMHVCVCVCVCMLALGLQFRLLFHIDRPYNCTYTWHYSGITRQHPDMYCVIFLNKYFELLLLLYRVFSVRLKMTVNESSLSQSGDDCTCQHQRG